LGVLELNLLGGFRVTSGGEPIAAVNTPRLQSLLAYLALRRGVPQARQTLAFMLWPESSEAQARTNLRTLLHRLRAALPGADDFLSQDPQAVAWLPGAGYRLDVDEFEAAVQAALPDAGDAAVRAALERANDLYQGELFPENYDDWVLAERERLHRMALGALETLVALLARGGLFAEAVTRARRLLQLDPLRETTYLSLMRLHLLQGERAGALRVYHECAATLRAELAVDPGLALRAAYADVMTADALASSPPEPLAMHFPLVGREAERARMRSAWQAAAQGRPHLLVLAGEAGLGKTRLAEELLAWAEHQGAATATARCYAAEGDLAFAPVTTWLRADAIRPRLARLEDVWLVEVARLAPELLTGHQDLASPGPMTDGWQRRRLLEALARAMLAGERPLLLMIDDLQWCDADTLEWLRFLLHHTPRARLMVLATLRPEEADAHQPVTPLLNELRGTNQLTEITLQPLQSAQTAALAGHVAGRGLSDAEAAGLYAETEGNPLFVVETLRAGWLAARGTAATELPPGVQAILAHRLHQLTPPARELLGVAAVLGRSFNVRVLAQAAEVGEPALVSGLDELWRRRLIREQGSDAYDFGHDKLRVAAYAELSPARRRSLHRRVAHVIESNPGTNLDAASGQIAAHYELAGQPDQAAAYYGQAAEVAERVFSHADAIGSLRRALALLPQPAAADKRRQAAGFAERLGDVLHMTGQYAEARAAYQRSLALMSPSDSADSERRLARAQVQCKLGNAWRDQYQYPEANAAYDTAEAELHLTPEATDPTGWRAWVQIALERLQTQYWLGQITEMVALIDALQPIVERFGSPLQHAQVHRYEAINLMRQHRGASDALVQAMAAYRNAIEAAGEAGMLPSARFNYGFAMVLNGDLDQAEPELLAALDLAERTGDISLEARCLTYLTMLYRKRRQTETVRPLAERSLRVATAAQMLDYVGAAKGSLAWLAWLAGDLAQTEALGRQALDAWGRTSVTFTNQWLALWPLLGAALTERQFQVAIAHALALLDIKQFHLPAAQEAALTQAVRAAEAGEQEAALAALLAAQDAAAELGYL
jgi:DNA-binding SARP family transcriptional activator